MSLPKTTIVNCIEFTITEHEGLVIFSETHGLALGAFKSRYSFRQGREGNWTVDTDQGAGNVAQIMGLYRVVESEYGARFGGHLSDHGQLCGPYQAALMPRNRNQPEEGLPNDAPTHPTTEE